MRVAYVCSDLGVPVLGRKGASVHVQAVVQVLVEGGHEVHLLAARTGGSVPPGLEPVRLHRLPAVPASTVAERERSARTTDAAVAGVLEGIGEVDLVYERYSLWGRTAMTWARQAGVPSVLEVNAPLVDEQAAHRELSDSLAAEDVARTALSAADVVVCVSAGVAAWVRSRTGDAERVHVVENGADVRRIRPAARPVTSATATPFTIGFVGTLKPWHGVATAIDALAVLDRDSPGAYRLLLVGDGPQGPALRERATDAGVTSLVEQVGAVDPLAVGPLLHRMDVAVAPYPAIDGFYFSPLKIYEYLAAGLPVIASAVGDIPALLRGGALGSLVSPGSPAELAGAIAALRADPQLRLSLRLASRAAAVEHHTWEAAVGRVLALSENSRRSCNSGLRGGR